MSHSSGTSDQGYKRATISNVFTSTPTDDATVRRHTISLSQIGTTSSSSENRTRDRLQSPIASKFFKTVKKRKVKKDRFQSIDPKESTEWETESVESIEEDLTDSRDSILMEKNNDAPINLFDDPCSPEKIRDAPTYESPLNHSPIIHSSRRFYLTSKKNIEQHDKLLPVNIPSSDVGNLKKTDKYEIKLNRTSNVKTYGPKVMEENLPSSIGNYWNFMYPMQYFSMSDILWEEFIEKNLEEMAEYLPSARARLRGYDTEFLRKYLDILPKFKSPPLPSDMICIRGELKKGSRKWVTHVYDPNKEKNKDDVCQTKAGKRNKRKRKERTTLRSAQNETDVYNTEDVTDIEFETGGRDGKRMSLPEFREKQKRMKKIIVIDTDSD